ncbi:MAG: hypothetical protein D4S01_00230 [Dehalococcoidia bacterium]|nr:MAG: hypothetical protein D4S01_00230 [Dehalococcoidia bacterium]
MPELVFKSLVKLLRAGICYEDQKGLTDYLKSQDIAPHWGTLLITIPQLRKKYAKAMTALHNELVPNYISVDGLYDSVWNLFKEVVLNKSVYQTSSNLDVKISDFCREVKKPLKVFDVVYEVRNFDVGSQRFNLGNVEVFKLTSDYLRSLGLDEETSAMEARVFTKWVGRSVAKVEVNASEIDRAYESGIIKVNSILNVVRVATVWERLSRLHDEMFLWELGDSLAIPKVRPKRGTLWGVSYHSRHHPLIIPMGDSLAKGLENTRSWKYILDGNLPEDINRRIIKAVEWISHGITSYSLDYKLVDLCTALEILLLPNHKEGLKGELIALRQVLIGQGSFHSPTGMLYWYEKRSSIIHTGALEVTSYSDYWHLLICCLEIVQNIVCLSQRYPHIHELEELIGIVENRENLEYLIEQCKIGILEGKGINKIKKAAEERLIELKQ